jgi:RimJ/RimL family protein N-acetyltransferase
VTTFPVLEGEVVRLEPLEPRHATGLAKAAVDRASYGYTWVPAGAQAALEYIAEALRERDRGAAVPFAVVLRDAEFVVGTTRFLDLQVFETSGVRLPVPGERPTVAEIGSTWYAAAAQRTAVNTECKLLLLGYAFEEWGVLRVTLKTDARNARSRAAIERIGAAFEGVRRVHIPASDGTLRDTAYYSIIRDEWPPIRARLVERMSAGQPKNSEQRKDSEQSELSHSPGDSGDQLTSSR